MQKIYRFLTLLLVVVLGACGGGGGSGGEPIGTLPFKVDIPVGEGTAANPVRIKSNMSRLFKISGGRTTGGADGQEKRSYLVNVEESGVVGLSWSKVGETEAEDLFAVTWISGPKDAKITVRDADDKQIVFYVRTDAPDPMQLALYTTAPDDLTVGVGGAAARVFDIGGGNAPYSVTSANNNVAVVEMVGNKQWRITGFSIGETRVIVRDGAGSTKDIAVKVGAPLLRMSPEKLTMPVGIKGVAKISGGQPPYRIAGGIPAAIDVSILGDEVNIIGNLASKLDVTIADTTGQTVKVEVEINTATTGVRFSPSAVVISENDTQPIDLTIFGAMGDVCIFMSDTTILRPETTGCTANRTIRLITAGGRSNRCVNADADIIVSVVDATRATGTATIKIVDNGPACGFVPPVIPAFVVTPTEVVVQSEKGTTSATSNQVVITGGSGNYIATSSDPSMAIATISGNVVTITGGALGAPTGVAIITIRDQADPARNATVSVTVR